MKFKTRYNIKKILFSVFWVLLGVSVIVLLGAAVKKKETERCSKIEISITGAYNNIFIDKYDVLKIIEGLHLGKPEGALVKNFSLTKMESALEQNVWIKNAEVFFDNNNVLWINIFEREPIARIFTSKGNSFYIDTSLTMIPLSDKFSARLPVFTGLVEDSSSMPKHDTLLLNDIKKMSTFIATDSFWMAQVDQVNILKDKTFELIPKLGNHVIMFGNATNYSDKFDNLKTFYKTVIPKVGLNKYSRLDIQYKGQVIAVKRGMEDVTMDSLRSAQIMEMIQANIQKQMDDSTTVQLTQHDENTQQVVPLIINTDMLPDSSEAKLKDSVLLKRTHALNNKQQVPKPKTPNKPKTTH
jgi:cell division protein FtsQ